MLSTHYDNDTAGSWLLLLHCCCCYCCCSSWLMACEWGAKIIIGLHRRWNVTRPQNVLIDSMCNNTDCVNWKWRKLMWCWTAETVISGRENYILQIFSLVNHLLCSSRLNTAESGSNISSSNSRINIFLIKLPQRVLCTPGPGHLTVVAATTVAGETWAFNGFMKCRRESALQQCVREVAAAAVGLLLTSLMMQDDDENQCCSATACSIHLLNVQSCLQNITFHANTPRWQGDSRLSAALLGHQILLGFKLKVSVHSSDSMNHAAH